MLQIIQGDCLTVIPTLPEKSVQCCVTSPPYWGLRDYGTAQWEGGEAGCNHLETNGYRQDGGRVQIDGFHGSSKTNLGDKSYRNLCEKCGARRIDSQLGLEATPEEYIAKMVAVFREVWRVLRDDGTLWLNLGDSYASTSYGGRNDGDIHHRTQSITDAIYPIDKPKNGRPFPAGLKPKDLCMMPARVAMALQADGWYLRSDIIWHKPNPMPESVTDRPTKAHEYIFLLAKQERYFYDAEAIREPSIDAGRIIRTNGNDGMCDGYDGHRTRDGFRRGVTVSENRNKRSVWTIPTQPYAEAHFATFPEDLVKPCILAGSKPGDTVLDPFAGSGTTGQVALELGRRAILIELNPQYIKLAERRCDVTPGFPYAV